MVDSTNIDKVIVCGEEPTTYMYIIVETYHEENNGDKNEDKN